MRHKNYTNKVAASLPDLLLKAHKRLVEAIAKEGENFKTKFWLYTGACPEHPYHEQEVPVIMGGDGFIPQVVLEQMIGVALRCEAFMSRAEVYVSMGSFPLSKISDELLEEADVDKMLVEDPEHARVFGIFYETLLGNGMTYYYMKNGSLEVMLEGNNIMYSGSLSNILSPFFEGSREN